jgi:ASC-1-like (ASCH) protein
MVTVDYPKLNLTLNFEFLEGIFKELIRIASVELNDSRVYLNFRPCSVILEMGPEELHKLELVDIKEAFSLDSRRNTPWKIFFMSTKDVIFPPEAWRTLTPECEKEGRHYKTDCPQAVDSWMLGTTLFFMVTGKKQIFNKDHLKSELEYNVKLQKQYYNVTKTFEENALDVMLQNIHTCYDTFDEALKRYRPSARSEAVYSRALRRLLDVNPYTRASCEEILKLLLTVEKK